MQCVRGFGCDELCGIATSCPANAQSKYHTLRARTELVAGSKTYQVKAMDLRVRCIITQPDDIVFKRDDTYSCLTPKSAEDGRPDGT